MKKKGSIKKEKVLNVIVLCFLFILPFFSTIFLYNRVFTLIELFFVLFIFIGTIFIYKDSRKNIKWIIIYIFCCLLYLLINYIRSFSFTSLSPNNFDYSIFNESLTICKIIAPVLFIYSLHYQNIKKEHYFKIINYYSLLISLVIIISSIFKFGYSSYGEVRTTVNIFEWLTKPYYIAASSRGLFKYANQIAIYLLLLFVLNVYQFIYNNKLLFINIFLLIISMLILGTRISSIGGLLVLIFLIIMYFIIELKNKHKINKRVYLLLIPIALYIILLPISPFANRNKELNEYQYYNIDNVFIEDTPIINKDSKINVDKKIDYVYNNYNPNYLPKIFFEVYYPINYDKDFWYQFVKKYSGKNINYRLIERSIIKRIIEINNKESDILFGISNSRIQNVVNVENDFLLHYYAFGIIGSVILLSYYLVLVIILLLRFFKAQTYINFIIVSMLLLFLFSSCLTGNIINSLNITIPCLFIISTLKTTEEICYNERRKGTLK